jgi:hypothetical protein
MLAAWTFLALAFVRPGAAWWTALAVLGIGLVLALLWNRRLGNNSKDADAVARLNQHILQAEEAGTTADLAPQLHPEFTIVRANGERQNKRAFLEAVPANRNRGRSADQVAVNISHECAVFTCRVMTTHDRDGNAAEGFFWNTRLSPVQAGIGGVPLDR